MKHTMRITLILLLLFLATQVAGLATLNKYIQVSTEPSGEIVITHQETVLGPPPEVPEKSYSWIPIVLAILIGTGLLLILIHFRLRFVWKLWFILSVWITVAVTLGVFISRMLAIIIGLAIALQKVIRPNVIMHNLTEIFVYTGIAIIVLPFLNLKSALILLLAISVYDMYAVWKSKHMIKLAKFQTESKVFAGLFVPYHLGVKMKPAGKQKKGVKKIKIAILGGGDMAFPLLFSGAVMEHLILVQGIPKVTALLLALLTSIGATAMLAYLLVKSEKGVFYPAMPFITIGCLIGYVGILIIG